MCGTKCYSQSHRGDVRTSALMQLSCALSLRGDATPCTNPVRRARSSHTGRQLHLCSSLARLARSSAIASPSLHVHGKCHVADKGKITASDSLSLVWKAHEPHMPQHTYLRPGYVGAHASLP